MSTLFWERFYDACINSGTKPNPLAKDIGISSGTITKWKQENVLPSGDNLYAIAKRLQISADYLLGITNEDKNLTKKGENNMCMSEAQRALLRRCIINEFETRYHDEDVYERLGIAANADSQVDVVGWCHNIKNNVIDENILLKYLDMDQDSLLTKMKVAMKANSAVELQICSKSDHEDLNKTILVGANEVFNRLENLSLSNVSALDEKIGEQLDLNNSTASVSDEMKKNTPIQINTSINSQ